jgi:5-methylcytosine-specific restriction protein A
MPRALKVCSTPSCPALVESGRCDECNTTADRARGTSRERGYNSTRWRTRRKATLMRDPLCTCHDRSHGHGVDCLAPSSVADHYPTSRKDLIAQGVVDPDALDRLRGICRSCHSKATATTSGQEGGWNRRDT